MITAKEHTASLKIEIEKRNKIWRKSTKRQKAVLLAKDVIERLNSKQLVADTGVWLRFGGLSSYDDDVPLQECILGNDSVCEACAMGGLMMSTIAYRNRVTTDALRSYNLDADLDEFNLSEAFSKDQLKLIELAYEGGHGSYSFDFNNSEIIHILEDNYGVVDEDLSEKMITKIRKLCKTKNDKCNMRIFSFYKRYRKDDTRRMRLIMENIIKNKGLFVI